MKNENPKKDRVMKNKSQNNSVSFKNKKIEFQSEEIDGIDKILSDLKGSETKLRQMFTSSPAGIFYFDKNLIITDFNKAFVNIFSAPSDRLKGLDLNNIVDKKFIPYLKRTLEGKPNVLTDWYQTTISGIKIYAKFRVYPLFSDNNSNEIIGGTGIIEDLTDWKITQEQLQEKEENLRITLQSIGDCVIVTDDKLLVTEMNIVAENITGYTLQRAKGKPITSLFKLINLKSKKQLSSPIEYALEKRRTVSLIKNVEIITSNGNTYQVVFSVAPILKSKTEAIGTVIVFQDISDSYKIQNELFESESRFHSLFENSPTGITLIGIEGNIIEVNEVMLKVLGSPSAELTKRINMLEFPPLVKVGFSKDFKNCIKTKKPIERTANYVTHWGKSLVLQYTIAPFIEKNGKITGAILNVVDVTEQKKAEEKEKKHLHDLEIISKSAIELVQLPLESDIYNFIGEKLKQIEEEHTIVINLKTSNDYKIEYVFATDSHLRAFKKIFKKKPQEIKSKPEVNLHVPNKFIEIPPEAFFLASGHFDPEGVKEIIKEQRVYKCYLFGLYAGNEYVGSVVIITYNNNVLRNIDVIETFLYQASLLIQRRMTQRKLSESEELYNTTLNSVSEFIHVVDTDLKILYANGALKNVLKSIGLDDNIVGMHINDAMPFLEKNVFEKYKEVIKKGELKFTEEANYLNKRTFLTQTIITPVFEEGKVKRLITSIRDVTENKLSAIEIASLKELNESIIQNMNEGIFMEDREGIIVMVNPSFCNMIGKSNEELIGKNALSIIPEELHKRVMFAKMNLAVYRNYSFEIEFKKKNGEIVTALHSFVPIFQEKNVKNIVSVFTDISRRKAIEQDLMLAKEKAEESEEKFRTIFETANDGILVADVETKKFVFANPQMCEMTGYSYKELTSIDVYKIHPPDFLELVMEKFNKQLKGEIRIADNLPVSKKNGEIFYCDINSSPMEFAGKKYLLGFFRDITYRKIAEQELIKSKLRIEESENLLRNILELSNLSMAIITFNGVIEFINKQAVKTFGYLPEDIPTMDRWWVQAYPDETYRTKVIDQWMGLVNKAVLENTEIERREYITTCKDGSVKTMIIFGVVVKDKVFVMFEDITERKNVEIELIRTNKKIEESEKRFRELYEKSGDAILIIRNGIFVDCNQATVEMLKYKNKKEFLDCHPSDVSPTSQPDGMNSLVKAELMMNLALEKGTHRFEWDHKKADGEVFPVEVLLTAISNEAENKIIHTVWRDITERKRAEDEILRSKEKIEESEEKFRSAFQFATYGIALISLEGRFMKVNDSLSNMLGYSEEELQNKTFSDITHHEDIDTGINLTREILEGKRKYFWLEKRYIHKNGNIIWGLLSASAIYDRNKKLLNLVAQIQNITDQKRVNDALKESEGRLKLISGLISDYIFQLDINQEGKAVMSFVSENFTSITGRKINEVQNFESWNRIFNEEDLKLVIEKLNHIILTGESLEFECRSYTKDNLMRWVQVHGRAIFDESKKKVVSIVGAVKDITERKKAEEDIINAMLKAEESDKLKSAFLANMSHELRTPINGIMGFSNLLLDQNLQESKREKYVSQIKASSSMLLHLIEDIIDIAKIESGKLIIEKSDCNIHNILDELFQFYRQDLNVRNKENVLLIYNKNSQEDLTIKTDPFRLRQVLTNLLSNAVKFTDSGKIEFGFEIKGQHILFYVIDSGIGIKMDFQKQIFERFTQVDISHTRKFGGTGLGLTISKNIIELLNGNIWVESEENKGSSFYFTIPADIVPSVKTNLDELIEEDIEFSWEKHTLLVAEDDDFNFMFIEEMLLPTKIKIIRAKNGKEAVDLVYKIPEINVVLMDIQMPIMDGYESTRLIKQMKPQLHVIAQTAYALSSEKEMSYQADCSDYITKPIDQKKLLKKINKLL